MVQSIFFLFCLILAPLVAHLRQWSPTALFAVATLVYAAFGGANFVSTQIVLSNIRETEPAYRDTYYVVNRGYVSLNLGLAMAVFAVLTWLQTRFGAMLYPKITKALFWLLHLGLIGGSAFSTMLVFLLPKPRRFIDYPEFMETFILVGSWATLISSIAVLGLLGLLVWSSALTWLASRNSGH
ncbi:hypothetical protein KQ247_11790 [Ruegeria pomeroyi]|uniref:Cytochrome c oxidase domain protein n=2 Tax=Ruegeria pomeroyi TaxID=89184 RepID=Q5LVS3_RUEPO|nr:cytochrome c oxidase domain-containing protein [Ruegeria pomeroyi]AAV97112.1 cytochrome c oxidase domain protein [Ruegeria pomeroyi DSS-3]NVK95491.1 hypothetical protein [Ruegeria pomeroyi]NVL03561.1 hypothetical protein [Ruegeria pomeroyi]QWV07525.1 hypothetical protein KQ247_11790 [Ruegeria pomeroyi]